jgi:hypothetical protein
MTNRVAALALAALLLPVPGSAQGFWAKKPFDQWSKNDCKKMLEDSPWALTESSVNVVFETVAGTGGGGGSLNEASRRANEDIRTEATGREANTEVRYTARLLSALPVRQALVRQQQLEQKYDSMTPEQKQKFDQQAQAFLQQQFPEHIVVLVAFSSNVVTRDRQMATYWQQQRLETVRENFQITGSAKRIVRPVAFTPPSPGANQMQLVFPRTVDGEPLVGPEDNSLVLEFTPPPVGNETSAKKIKLEFKVKKMLLDGKLVY